MPSLLTQKLDQASCLVAESNLDIWLVFVRETGDGTDPVLPFILEGSLVWLSALIFDKKGQRIAVVGHYDADPLESSGHWTKIARYHQDIWPALRQTLEEICPENPRIGVNFSLGDEKCDGLTHGMFLLLEGYFKGTRFEGTMESAESICMALRGRKTLMEVERMKAAIAEGDKIFEEIGRFAEVGKTEREVFDHVHAIVREKGLGFAWDPVGDPIVNSGPNSMIGHGVPSPTIQIEPGHIFHVDLGVVKNGYSSDIQRSWFVGGNPPEDVLRAFDAIRAAILAAFELVKPGIEGWRVDAAARTSLLSAGYEEYLHATGHQVGRVAHDGGALLGPKWERYGDRPNVPVSEGEVYTLELGVILPGRGYLGLEEMVQVTASGCEWLSKPQTEIWRLA
jgi:Xaa-Pro aminopeptidase